MGSPDDETERQTTSDPFDTQKELSLLHQFEYGPGNPKAAEAALSNLDWDDLFARFESARRYSAQQQSSGSSVEQKEANTRFWGCASEVLAAVSFCALAEEPLPIRAIHPLKLMTFLAINLGAGRSDPLIKLVKTPGRGGGGFRGRRHPIAGEMSDIFDAVRYIVARQEMDPRGRGAVKEVARAFGFEREREDDDGEVKPFLEYRQVSAWVAKYASVTPWVGIDRTIKNLRKKMLLAGERYTRDGRTVKASRTRNRTKTGLVK